MTIAKLLTLVVPFSLALSAIAAPPGPPHGDPGKPQPPGPPGKPKPPQANGPKVDSKKLQKSLKIENLLAKAKTLEVSSICLCVRALEPGADIPSPFLGLCVLFPCA